VDQGQDVGDIGFRGEADVHGSVLAIECTGGRPGNGAYGAFREARSLWSLTSGVVGD
jgi:hypothetical protein